MKLILRFPFLYLSDVVMGAFRVAIDVLRPTPRLNPILLHVPVSLTSPTRRYILASLVSMTPGTISIMEKDGGRILLVHSLYGGDDPEAAVREIQERYESFLTQLP